MPLRASRESPQGLALSLEHLENGQSCPWDPVPPGWFTPLSCSLCTLPWLLPLSQRECQLGAALVRSVEEGTGAPAVPKAGAVEHCWSWVGCPALEGTGKGQVPWGATQIWKPCLKHCHSMSPALAAMGTDMHLSFCTGIAQPPFLAFWPLDSFFGCPWASTLDSIFISFDSEQPSACCSAPGQLSAPPSMQPHPSSGGNRKDH